MDLTLWMDQYGYWVLFGALLIELIAFGLPTEVLMGYAGVLVYQGKLAWLPAIIAAGLGSMLGISIAYWIGAWLGAPFFAKYGQKIHLGPDRMDKVSHWFEVYGDKLILVAYFIPGVRHVTGYFSGIMRIPFYKFATYAYLGAALWVTTFVTLGKVLGPQWERYHHLVSKYLIYSGLVTGLTFIIIWVYKRYKKRIIAGIEIVVKHSALQARALIFSAAGLFFIFVAMTIQITEEHLGHEFSEFNSLVTLVLQDAFPPALQSFLQLFAYLASPVVLIPLSALTLAWIAWRGQDKALEVVSFIIVVSGGVFLEEALQYLFFRMTPPPLLSDGTLSTAFPGEHSLMSLTIWAFAGFVVARHTGTIWIKALLGAIVVLIALALGLSRISLGVQAPSDIVAGYVFAGVWLSLSIAVIEIFRELRRIQSRA